ncbi:uncharacterized protein LOC142624579 [Castanea sativa]|uniref:uncharacterized protein LOC142624579 n=1 Tax=Castanea sativa TaxID=21020 RepID=UPI003F64D7DD
MCKAFSTTLKGPARVWFSKIPPSTVGSFEELSKFFVNNFIGGQRHKRSSSSLLTIEQGENESLQSFITQFNRETLTVDEMDDKLLLVGLHKGVNFDLFIHKLYEQEPQTMVKLVHSTQNFMNAEDATITNKRKRAERIEADPSRHPEQGLSTKSRKTYLKVVQNVQLFGQSPRTREVDEQAITFTEEDFERIHHPYDDAIVITLLIADYTTRRVLVGNGSLVDILYYPAFQQIRLGRDQLCLVNSPLVGFGGMKMQPVGTITLPVVVGAYPQQITKEVNFLVIDCSLSYNAIIGRPTLNSWKVVTSTYHLSIKFPTEYGVGQVQGDQLATRECYLAMLAMDEHVQTMSVDEKRITAEPTEVLEDIPLDESNPKKFTRIGASIEKKTKQNLIQFLMKKP